MACHSVPQTKKTKYCHSRQYYSGKCKSSAFQSTLTHVNPEKPDCAKHERKGHADEKGQTQQGENNMARPGFRRRFQVMKEEEERKNTGQGNPKRPNCPDAGLRLFVV
jgi:hypothetical protein